MNKIFFWPNAVDWGARTSTEHLFFKTSKRSKLYFIYLYIYPPDSQESDGGAIHRASNYPDLLPEIRRYCCPLVI